MYFGLNGCIQFAYNCKNVKTQLSNKCKNKFFFVTDCSGCINGSYGCSSECFAYQCNSSNCDFIDEDQLCENNNADDGNNEIEDYDSGIYNEICAYTSM